MWPLLVQRTLSMQHIQHISRLRLSLTSPSSGYEHAVAGREALH